MLNNSKSITIVIPCYNEARRLPQFLSQMCRVFRDESHVKILVVDDGSRALDAHIMDQAIQEQRQVKAELDMIRLPKNQGKGAALRQGFHAATTDIVGFLDGDGSVGAHECYELIEHFLKLEAKRPCCGVMGSRVRMLGNPVDRTWKRHASGRIFASILSLLFRIPVYDSQCGAKFYLKKEIDPLLKYVIDDRWLFDTQLLILLCLLGYPIFEVPVPWHETAGSKVKLLKDSVRMFMGLLRYRKLLTKLRLAGQLPPSWSSVPQSRETSNPHAVPQRFVG